MAIARKYRRKIVVDGQTYHWVTRNNWDSVNVTIESAQYQGSKLLTGFDAMGKSQPILPSEIRRVILQALASGWRPQSKGPVWLYRSPEDQKRRLQWQRLQEKRLKENRPIFVSLTLRWNPFGVWLACRTSIVLGPHDDHT